MAERAHITGGSRPLPLEIIPLDQHPDGELLRLCGRMTNLQDRWDEPGAELDRALSRDYWSTSDRIAAIHPKTADGFQMKAMVALAMLYPSQRQVEAMCDGRLSVWAGAVAIVNDVIRGLPA